ncbi:hypothetical protein PVAG01_08888 [Phlyctema vagabunda]|uniref:DUF7924 domain-containing protein n=1 Tax=Phlyctema vagabunda TaxID=108571 RepID=A0ABR4PAS5_9HELO
MATTQEQKTSSYKRARAEADLSATCVDARSLEKARRKIKLHSAAFYDSLLKVLLTRRALKELHRRTSHINNGSRYPAPRTDWQEYQRGTWKKQLRRFARHGGPELFDLRGYPEPTNLDITRAMSSSRSSRTAPTSYRRSTAYDKNFEQHLVQHRIYIKGYEYPDDADAPEPGNIDVLRERLARPRPSLSPSQFTTSDFRTFERRNDRLIDEGEVMRDVVPIIARNANIRSKQDLLFTRLDPITGKTTVDAKPDLYDGALLTGIDKRVRDDIGDYIIPTYHPTAPVLPNFFLEVKGPSGGMDVAKRQACYDGALGARAMHQLQSYGQDEPVYDGNAYTISTTYVDGQLKIYTTHPGQASDGTTEYHMTQIRVYALTSDADSFRQGATAFRNVRDWAQEQRNGFISAANDRARAMNAQQSG